MKKELKAGNAHEERSDKALKERLRAERQREGLRDEYAPGHCTMCQIRWGKFDRPEDTVRVIRELQDIQEWLLYRRKYTNMTTPNGEDPED